MARWYCPQARATIGLLPDFYASRMPGTWRLRRARALRLMPEATEEAAPVVALVADFVRASRRG